MTKTLKVRHSAGRDKKSVITVEHICGDYAEFSLEQLIGLAAGLLKIAGDVQSGRLQFNETKEYEL